VKINLRTLAFCSVLLLSSSLASIAQKNKANTSKIKPITSHVLAIPEPSDVAVSFDGQSLFIVSDNGMLFQTDLQGNILKEATHKAFDLEAVFATENFVYAVDERTRLIHEYTLPNLIHVRELEVPYFGGRNKGYEGMTYNPVTKRFLLAVEKDPTMIFELDQDFKIINRIDFKGVSDISSITYYNGSLYVLSDENHCVLKVNPSTYSIEYKWKTNLLNPEGIAFLPNGELLLVSDDMGILYKYSALTQDNSTTPQSK